MRPDNGRAKKSGSVVRRRVEPQAADTVTTDAVSGAVSDKGLGEAIESVAIEIVDKPEGRSRPPGAVDDFIERWVGREDVRRILEAWAK